MVDFLASVDSDMGPKEPTPVTLVRSGAEVAIGANGPQASTASQSVTPATDALFTTFSRAATSMATNQTSVGTTATLIAPARPNRDRLQIIVTTATATALGNAGVTMTSGFPLPATANTSMTVYATGPIYMVANAAVTVGVVDYYNG